jgi:hypothetical protein
MKLELNFQLSSKFVEFKNKMFELELKDLQIEKNGFKLALKESPNKFYNVKTKI